MELFQEDGTLNPARDDVMGCDGCGQLTQEIYCTAEQDFICLDCYLIEG